MDLKSTAIDMLSLSGHKFHGRKGVGALYIKSGVPFHGPIKGGHQQRDRRAGTENTPGIVGRGKAAELALECMDEENTGVNSLRDRLEKGFSHVSPTRSSTSICSRGYLTRQM